MVSIILIILSVFLFFTLAGMLGKIYNEIIGKSRGNGLFIGFFLYFALFEIVALPMIMMQKTLSSLTVVWSVVCFVIVGAFFVVLFCKRKDKGTVNIRQVRDSIAENLTKMVSCKVFLAALFLVLAQTIYASLRGYSGWDSAFYIGSVVEAVETDTMWIYDGYTGWRESAINLKYAMCSFYMHDAVVARIFGVHGAIVCRIMNVLICHFFSAYVVYLVAMKLLKKKQDAYAAVCFWVIANFGISTIYQANYFLMERSYEAKAYCANIVVVAVILVLLKLIDDVSQKKKDDRAHWMELFIINCASVAISSSCLLLIPLMEGIFYLILLFSKNDWKLKWSCTWKIFICILPSVGYLLLYFLNHFSIWKIVIS